MYRVKAFYDEWHLVELEMTKDIETYIWIETLFVKTNRRLHKRMRTNVQTNNDKYIFIVCMYDDIDVYSTIAQNIAYTETLMQIYSFINIK